jgi:hypothetical protein
MSNKNPSPSNRFKPGTSGFEGRKHNYVEKRKIANNLLPLAAKVLKSYLENGLPQEQLKAIDIVFKYSSDDLKDSTVNIDGIASGATFTINGINLSIPFRTLPAPTPIESSKDEP